MISDAKLDNYRLFCEKAKSYCVCDKMSGDDKHKRIHMGKDEYSRTVYYGCLRKDSMKVFYRSTDKVDINVSGGSRINVPTDENGYNYYSEVKPADYDAFLSFVSSKLGRKQSHVYQDINTPMMLKDRVRKADGTVQYICGRCGVTFIKSPRCPECGQLVKE